MKMAKLIMAVLAMLLLPLSDLALGQNRGSRGGFSRGARAPTRSVNRAPMRSATTRMASRTPSRGSSVGHSGGRSRQQYPLAGPRNMQGRTPRMSAPSNNRPQASSNGGLRAMSSGRGSSAAYPANFDGSGGRPSGHRPANFAGNNANPTWSGNNGDFRPRPAQYGGGNGGGHHRRGRSLAAGGVNNIVIQDSFNTTTVGRSGSHGGGHRGGHHHHDDWHWQVGLWYNQGPYLPPAYYYSSPYLQGDHAYVYGSYGSYHGHSNLNLGLALHFDLSDEPEVVEVQPSPQATCNEVSLENVRVTSYREETRTVVVPHNGYVAY